MGKAVEKAAGLAYVAIEAYEQTLTELETLKAKMRLYQKKLLMRQFDEEWGKLDREIMELCKE